MQNDIRSARRLYHRTYDPSQRDHCSSQEVGQLSHHRTTHMYPISSYRPSDMKMTIQEVPAFFCSPVHDINKEYPASATSLNYIGVRVDCWAIYGLIRPARKRIAASMCNHMVIFSKAGLWYLHRCTEIYNVRRASGSRIFKHPLGSCCARWDA